MALNINGTTGISGVDGSASAASIAGTDSNTGLSFASDTVNINTGGITRATIDSSGALDVPTNFPIKVAGSEKFKIDTSGNLTFSLEDSSNYPVQKIKWSNDSTTTNGFYIAQHSDRSGRIWHEQGLELVFGTSNAERMRITSDGYVGIGTNNPHRHLEVLDWSESGASRGIEVGVVGIRSSVAAASTENHLRFYNTNNQVGSITTASSATSFNTSSDYRLKENVVSISDGITRIKQLKPSKFNWISDKTNTPVDGFLAHEVSSIVPESITGTKDAVATQKDVDDAIAEKVGDPIYQSIDQSKLIPLLTAALQEAVAKIEVLETKVAALEAA